MRNLVYCLGVIVCLGMLSGCFGSSTPAPKAEPAPEPIKATPVQAIQALTKTGDPVEHISGGWGYAHGDALVITTPKGAGKERFDPSPMEYTLLKLRNDMEFTFNLPEGKRNRAVHFKPGTRSLVREGDKIYDVFKGDVYVAAEKDLPEIRALAQKAPAGSDPLTPEVMKKITVHPREYWFDITEPFYRNAALIKGTAKPARGTPRSAQPAL